MPEKVLLDSYKPRQLNIRVHNKYDGSPITNIEVGLYLASAQVTAAFVSSDVGKVEGGKWLIPSLASGNIHDTRYITCVYMCYCGVL